MSDDRIRVLWLDDDVSVVHDALYKYRGDLDVTSVTTVRDARAFIEDGNYDAVITDVVLPLERGGPSGSAGALDFIGAIRQKDPNLPVLVYSAFPSEFSDELKALGANVVLSKAADLRALPNAVRQLVAESRQRRERDRKQYVREDQVRAIVEDAIKELIPEKERTLDLGSNGRFELIKPLVGYKRDIEEHLRQYPFETNVFLMMKFRPANSDLATFIKETLAAHGLHGVRADDPAWNITSNVYNPIAVLYCCRFGIALFDEPEQSQAYSPNVAYELGMMHYQGKDCLILRHSSLPAVPFDLIKDLYQVYDRDLQVRHRIEVWASQVGALAK